MLAALTRNWWVLLLQGIVAILFAVFAFAMPGAALLTLVLLFAVYALVDGILAIGLGVSSRREYDQWWVLLLLGLLGIAAAVVALRWPGITVIAMLSLLAAWAIVRGVLLIIAAIRLRHEIEGEWLLILTGVLSVALGVALVVWPDAGVLTMVWLVGAYALLVGVLLIALSFRVRRVHRDLADVGM